MIVAEIGSVYIELTPQSVQNSTQPKCRLIVFLIFCFGKKKEK